MQTHVATTPFGRRPVTLGLIASQAAARCAPDGAQVQKWAVFQNIREARDALGATDRSLAILNALLTFHRDPVLKAEAGLIVWPSNEQLAARANGMSATTLRRHLAVLVDRGLVIRRDSPNGKRFARRGGHGEIEQAYGFDLTPIVARAQEFADLAKAVQAEKKALRIAKEHLTLLRRDIVKMIDAAIEENVPGSWGQTRQSYERIMARLPRTPLLPLVEAVRQDLHVMWFEIRETLEFFAESQNLDANESRSGAHIQNSNAESFFESESGSGEKREERATAERNDALSALPKHELPLGIVMDACPAVLDLADGGTVRQWRDFLAAVELARPMLAVSPSAWREAREVMGDQAASVTLAAIYQRSDGIRSAGGYLRALTERARNGKFSPWPMVMALVRAKLDRQRELDPGALSTGILREKVDDVPGYVISDRLKRHLARPTR